MDTVVIGAGPAGLTAAYELRKLGRRATVLEADSQVGGISRTVDYQGYRFDLGGHRFFSKVPLVNELWHEMLGPEMLVRPRLSRICYRNCFFDYPLRVGDVIAKLGLAETAIVAMSCLKAKLAPSLPETSFEQWVTNRFGRRLYEIFFKAYTEKVWGIPCGDISSQWAAQRIKGLSFVQAVRHALGAGRKDGQVITTLIEEFLYPRRGPGMMWERCRDLLGQRGTPTLTGIHVERLRHKAGRVYCAQGHDASGNVVEFGADAFLSSMPLREIVESLDPVPPDDVLQAARSLRYRDFLTVVLIARRQNIFPDTWIYIHTPDIRMGRIQNYKNWSPEMVPDQSRTSLGLEYFLWEHDEMWSWSDQKLIDLGKHECAKLGFIQKDEVEDGTVVRMKKAYPVYDRSYQANVKLVRRYLERLDNLQCIGRNGQHRYNNQDHSMMTGVFAARNVVGERHDIWSINVEQDYHEEVRSKPQTAGVKVPPPQAVPAQEGLETVLRKVFASVDPVAMGVAVAMVCATLMALASGVVLAGGAEPARNALSLLSAYIVGYDLTWLGVLLGTAQAGILGFVLGWAGASMRNGLISAYVRLIHKAATCEKPASGGRI